MILKVNVHAQHTQSKHATLFLVITDDLRCFNFSPAPDIQTIELMINKLHGLSPSGGLVSPSGGFASLFFDQVGYFASIKLCQALSRQGAIIKIPVVRCHYLLCSSAQFFNLQSLKFSKLRRFQTKNCLSCTKPKSCRCSL